MKKLAVIVASVVTLGLGAIVLAPAPVYASCDGVSGTQLAACAACEAEPGATWSDGTCDTGGKSATEIIQIIINVMLFIVGILSIIMIIFGGIRYVTSAGDKGKVDNAKNTIVYSVVGLVVAIVAFALVQWVFNALQ
ncbi:pilin [Candidatus Saccharibacteria bacterium]|nr:pilin [Candidatus Saccharibacteria bacterium]